ncbi:MAG: GDSL-type esterase/lipase family protein [Rhodococcus fascians]
MTTPVAIVRRTGRPVTRLPVTRLPVTRLMAGAAAAMAMLVTVSCAEEDAVGPSVVVLGDSLSAPIGDPENAAQDWFATANADANMQLISNAGIGGETTDQILARVDNDVLAQAPEFTTVLAGTNDVFKGVDAATITTNLSLIYDKLAFTDVGIIAFTIPPMLMEDEVKAQTLRDVNAWMRATVESNWPDAQLVDWSEALSADGDEALPNASYFSDGIHFTEEGADAAGEAAAPTLESIADAAADSATD